MLEDMSLEELQEEAERYLLPHRSDRATLIDNIMTHLERHGPAQDLLGEKNTEPPRPRRGSAAGDEPPITATALKQALATVTNKVLQQQRQIQLQHQKMMQQQQQQFAHMLQVLADRLQGSSSPLHLRGQ